jgi:hypothetical protein
MNGKKCRSDTTFLPSRELLVASRDVVSFVDIADADNSRWQLLEKLGVSIKVDVSVYLCCLEKLALEQSNDHMKIARLFDTLQLRSDN